MSQLFHLHIGAVQRSKGGNAVKASAYNLCARLIDGNGKRYNFERKRKEYQGGTILLPAGAPEWAADPGELWRRAELAETRLNSQPSRELEFAIPRCVPPERRLEFACHIVQPLVDAGRVAQVDVHSMIASDGGEQPHAHVLLTTRSIDGEGFKKSKNREWEAIYNNERGRALRGQVAERMNLWLAANGHDQRVDHRSNRQRGLLPPMEPNVPSWQFEHRRDTGDTPRALNDLLVQRRARKAGYILRQAVEVARSAERHWTAQLDALTVRSQKNAFRPSDPEKRRARKERLIAMLMARHYDQQWLPQRVAKRIERIEIDAAHCFAVIHLRDGSKLIDAGDHLTLRGRWSADGIAEMAEAAARNKWSAVEVSGSTGFRDAITLELRLRQPPVSVSNHVLSPEIQARLDAELALRAAKAERLAEEARQLKAARRVVSRGRIRSEGISGAPESAPPVSAPLFLPSWQRAVRLPSDRPDKKQDPDRR